MVRRLWLEMHQEPDGSLSPTDFDWNCTGDLVCAGLGRESFRIAATALMLTVQANAGYPLLEGAPRRALDYVFARQWRDGRFAGRGEPHCAMTNATGAIALCRALAMSKRDRGGAPPIKLQRTARLSIQPVLADQNPDGSWGTDQDESMRLSTSVWNLLALRAGALAGVEADPAIAERGRAWVQTAVAAIEARADGTTGPLALTRARASRAVALAATAGSTAQVAEDVTWLMKQLDLGGAPVRDAEALLFGSLAAPRCGEPILDDWCKRLKSHVLNPQARDGCAEGSWLIPTIWLDLGGRLVSTAFMTWALELYYRYPTAGWAD
jgi:hypothetical protein